MVNVETKKSISIQIIKDTEGTNTLDIVKIIRIMTITMDKDVKEEMTGVIIVTALTSITIIIRPTQIMVNTLNPWENLTAMPLTLNGNCLEFIDRNFMSSSNK